MRLFTLSLQLEPTQASRLRSWLRDRFADSRLSRQATRDLVLAADEAFALAVGRCSKECEAVVRVSVLGRDVYLTFTDNAQTRRRLEPDPFGMALLQALADQFQLEEDETGATVRLVKKSARSDRSPRRA